MYVRTLLYIAIYTLYSNCKYDMYIDIKCVFNVHYSLDVAARRPGHPLLYLQSIWGSVVRVAGLRNLVHRLNCTGLVLFRAIKIL